MVRMQEGLRENGCRVRMMCFNTSKHPVSIHDLDPKLVEEVGLTAVEVDNRVRPRDAIMALFHNRSYHLSRFSNPSFRLELEELLKQESFDAFILESIYMQEAIPVIRSLSKNPVVLRAHNVEHRIWRGLASTEKNPLKKWYLNHLADQLEREERRILGEVDGVLAITADDARILQTLVPKLNVMVVPTGSPAESNTSDNKPDPFLVAHIGAMDWQPNVEGIQWFITEVWPEVIAKVPQARLKLAGKNMPDSLMKYTSSTVSVEGFVKDAGEFLSDAGIIVVPLLNGSGMRIKLLEGLAMGKAIVTTPIGCEGIPVTDGENVLIAPTADAFSQALIRLLSDPGLQDRLRTSGRELVRNKFDTARIGQDAVRFVQKLAGN